MPHHNAHPYIAKITESLIKQFKWDIFGHLPYSLNLSSYNYHLFHRLKKFLAGRHFATGAELQAVVMEFFSKQDCVRYGIGIEKLVLCRNKYVNNSGGYVEK